MKTSIHPTYYTDCSITCACGNTFTGGSTLKDIRVEICSACHPFFTGEMKFVDTMGRVDKFEAARRKAEKLQSKVKAKKDKSEPVGEPMTLKEMLQEVGKQA